MLIDSDNDISKTALLGTFRNRNWKLHVTLNISIEKVLLYSCFRAARHNGVLQQICQSKKNQCVRQTRSALIDAGQSTPLVSNTKRTKLQHLSAEVKFFNFSMRKTEDFVKVLVPSRWKHKAHIWQRNKVILLQWNISYYLRSYLVPLGKELPRKSSLDKKTAQRNSQSKLGFLSLMWQPLMGRWTLNRLSSFKH